MTRLQALALLLALSVSGCGGPMWLFAGGELSGPQASIVDANLTGEGGLIQLETEPSNPYSVNLGSVFINGVAHIDPAEDRAWYQNIKVNPNVRVRFDGDHTVYLARAERVTDTESLDRFEADRIVLRLVPRSS